MEVVMSRLVRTIVGHRDFKKPQKTRKGYSEIEIAIDKFAEEFSGSAYFLGDDNRSQRNEETWCHKVKDDYLGDIISFTKYVIQGPTTSICPLSYVKSLKKSSAF